VKAPVPLEIAVQASIIAAVRRAVLPCDVLAIPNAGKRGRGAQASVKREGIMRGSPDLAVVWPGGVGFLEIKRPGYTDSAVSPEQRALLARWADWGINVGIASSIDEALDLLRSWGAPVMAQADTSRLGRGDAVAIFGAL